MLTDEQFEVVQPKLKTIQIIAAALASGVVMFAFVTNVIAPWAKSTMEISMLPLLGAFAMFFFVLLSFVVPPLVSGNVPRVSSDDDSDQQSKQLNSAANVFTTTRLIRLALLEGASFLNLVVYILDKSQVSLIAAAVGLFLLMIAFPTASSMRSWIEAKAFD